MMSSKENFDDLKASFDDDLEQLNQEFDQLLLKKLSLEHALEQDQLFDELAQEDEQIDKLAANRPDLDAAIKDQMERCQKKRLQKHNIAVSQEDFTPGCGFSGCIPCWIHRFVFYRRCC